MSIRPQARYTINLFEEKPWRRWKTADDEAPKEDACQEEQGRPAEAPAKELDPLALKDKEIAELTDTLKRLQAEFENYKKRQEKDWAERIKLANHSLVSNMLAVLDSFDKALEDAERNDDPASLRKGLEGLRRQFLQTLQKEGLKEIGTDGKFDPFVHEALMREERDDVEDGTILEVFQKGYTLGQRTLRPARVKVAKLREPEDLRQKEGAQVHDNKAEESASKNEEKTPDKR